VALVALAVACLLAGCPGRSDPVSGSTAGAASPAPTSSSGTRASSTPPAGTGPPITIALAGDVHFANQVAALLEHRGAGLSPLEPHLAASDLAMLNLETAITARGTPQPKQFHFRAPYTALTALAAAGVDVVSLANNHAVDYGEVGLRDTLAAKRRSPIPVVGIGENAAQAYAPAYLKVRGHSVAVLAATQVPDWTLATWTATANRAGVASAASPRRLARAVRAAAARADTVLVYLHWGTDYTSCPNGLQKRTAKALAAAGADLVVGAHAHRLQGAGWLGRTYVDYGLGNFIWWRRNSAADATTGVLTVSIAPSGGHVTSARWTPMTVSASGLPQVETGASGRKLRDDWAARRSCTGLRASPAG
jgi:poly-gamma-glutamate synthesis protein (capsule biosynthesis protein)